MTTDQPLDQPQAATVPAGDIIARPGKYYRNTRYLMFVLLVGMGCWFAYDGWVGWPRENAIVEDLKREQTEANRTSDVKKLEQVNTDLKKHKEHSHWDVMIQRVLGFALPPLGLAMLLWALQQSRGEYRMSGTKISVPGHPTIDLNDIKSVNNDLWDRKGIVWVEYAMPDGQAGEFRLDDFLYDRPPTDQIYDRIAEHMGLDEEEDDDESEDEVGDEDEAADQAAEAPTETREP